MIALPRMTMGGEMVTTVRNTMFHNSKITIRKTIGKTSRIAVGGQMGTKNMDTVTRGAQHHMMAVKLSRRRDLAVTRSVLDRMADNTWTRGKFLLIQRPLILWLGTIRSQPFRQAKPKGYRMMEI